MSASIKPEAKRQSGKRPKKRHFTCNKYTYTKTSVTSSPVQNLNQSASGRKIHLDEREKPTNDDFNGYSIFDTNLLFQNLEKYLSCKTCGGNISMKEEVVCGLSTIISAECQNCKLLFSCRNSKMLGKKKKYPRNQQEIYVCIPGQWNGIFCYAIVLRCHGTSSTSFCKIL